MEPAITEPPPKPILYAEDEEDDAYFMRRAFKTAAIAHPLVVVPDGQQAIEYLSGAGCYSNRDEYPLPCLLLLDLNLPKKSGIEVLTWIRNDTSVSTLPVIVLTSSLQDADIHRAYVQGANAYLVKPSSIDQLVRTVKTIRDFWLNQNRSDQKSWESLAGE